MVTLLERFRGVARRGEKKKSPRTQTTSKKKSQATIGPHRDLFVSPVTYVSPVMHAAVVWTRDCLCTAGGWSGCSVKAWLVTIVTPLSGSLSLFDRSFAE